MKRLVLGIAMAMLFGNTALAADLTITDSTPKPGSSISIEPNVVSITASAPLVDLGTIIVVNDPNGTAVDDGSIAINGNTAVVGMKPLTVTGVYTVNYTLVSDGLPEVTSSYTFMYSAPGAITSPSAQPTASSGSTTVNGNNAASNAFVYFLLFLAALVAIFLVWYARVSFGGKPKRRAAPAQVVPKAPVKKAASKRVTKKTK